MVWIIVNTRLNQYWILKRLHQKLNFFKINNNLSQQHCEISSNINGHYKQIIQFLPPLLLKDDDDTVAKTDKCIPSILISSNMQGCYVAPQKLSNKKKPDQKLYFNSIYSKQQEITICIVLVQHIHSWKMSLGHLCQMNLQPKNSSKGHIYISKIIISIDKT